MLARTFEILFVALRLGLTSFGGPVAHLGYFRQEYVASRKWLDERTYADLVALCQFLPGPTSSQVGIAVGISRGGLLGGFAAWLGFTLPSAAILILFAYGVAEYGEFVGEDWLRGLKIVAVAVVALAVWEMARTLAPDRTRATIAIATAIALLLWQSPAGYVVLIVASGLAGWLLLRREADPTSPAASPTPFSRYLAIAGLCLFFHPAPRVAAHQAGMAKRLAGHFRRVLPQRLDGVRRRTRSAATAPVRGRDAGMGDQRRVHRRVWRGAGDTRAAVYLLGLSRDGHGRASGRLEDRGFPP